MKPPKPIERLTNAFVKLPGIGPKSAQRLTYYLLHVPQEQLDQFAQALSGLKRDTKLCSQCFNIADSDPCSICDDSGRDQTRICIVEQPLDIYAIERSGAYKGLYHVLHGSLNPLDNIGPQDLHIHDIIPRLQLLTESGKKITTEIVVATNPTMEGEATALYIQQLITKHFPQLPLTRIGRGLPTGADLEYADELTVSKAFEGRRGM